VLSVNHNLRAEALDELNYVKKLATDLGLEFIPLSWQAGDRGGNLQARARKGRYDLMCEACALRNIKTLLTAHHKDDFIENYLIRESRGSSVFGLSSSHSYFYNNTQILRPLFSIPKKQLTDYLVQNNIKWFEDSSNSLEKYQRNRIRKQLEAMEPGEKIKIEQKIEEAGRQAQVLSDWLISAIAEVCQINNFGFASLDLERFRKLEHIIGVQLIAYVLAIISGSSELPRYRNTEKILLKIASRATISNSIHNCIVITVGDKLLIFKEKSKITPELIPLVKNTLWDNRFEIIFDQNPEEKLFISSLNMEEYTQIKTKLDLDSLSKFTNNNHTKILFTLPIIKNLEKVVAIPHISYYDNEQAMRVKVIFKPNFISRFTHFF
jgi:tRNA(Ile)-lysidine synthase